MRDTKKGEGSRRGRRTRSADAIPARAGTAYWAWGPPSVWSSATRRGGAAANQAVSLACGDAGASGEACLAEVGTRQEGGERGVQAAHPRSATAFRPIPAAVCAIGSNLGAIRGVIARGGVFPGLRGPAPGRNAPASPGLSHDHPGRSARSWRQSQEPRTRQPTDYADIPVLSSKERDSYYRVLSFIQLAKRDARLPRC
jgi:hypothetical protein